ncbi:MAG: RNA-protein complex protein Nop10 [Candidatus Micrarchaeota archaeon]|nr:RNA-protein complex protein Nop10 [Candidatus Micrarchaeota archaeon]
MSLLRKCPKTKNYTLKKRIANIDTINPHPPRFDPLDKVGEYRRKIKYGKVKE